MEKSEVQQIINDMIGDIETRIKDGELNAARALDNEGYTENSSLYAGIAIGLTSALFTITRHSSKINER